MAAPRTIFVFVTTLAYTAHGDSSGGKQICSTGERVSSIDVHHGWFLDALRLTCTKAVDSSVDNNLYVPNETVYDKSGGGDEFSICAGTGGVKTIVWYKTEELAWIASTITVSVMVNVTITCMNGTHPEVLANG